MDVGSVDGGYAVPPRNIYTTASRWYICGCRRGLGVEMVYIAM